jgi:hypothetical protein
LQFDEMIEMCAWAADSAQLVAAENAPNTGFGRFGARFIRKDHIRGHDKKCAEPVDSLAATVFRNRAQ